MLTDNLAEKLLTDIGAGSLKAARSDSSGTSKSKKGGLISDYFGGDSSDSDKTDSKTESGSKKESGDSSDKTESGSKKKTGDSSDKTESGSKKKTGDSSEKTKTGSGDDKTETESGTTESVGVPVNQPAKSQKIDSKYIFIFVIVVLLAVIVALLAKIYADKKKTFAQSYDIPGDTENPVVLPVQVPKKGLSVAKIHHIGKRPSQQDSFGLSDITNDTLTETKGTLVVVADGMGGLKGGDQVSSCIVTQMLTDFVQSPEERAANEELDRLLNNAVAVANDCLTRTVGLKKGGSTLISGIVKDNMFSWISVGDSRIAIFRNGKLSDLNKKHNWGTELDEKVLRGEITAQQAATDIHRQELTSYVGMGQLKYVDRSVYPVPLQPGDRILFMTDGIFNTLRDAEIEQILMQPIETVSETVTASILNKNLPNQDNFTAVILEYQ